MTTPRPVYELQLPTSCSNCGSDQLTWQVDARTNFFVEVPRAILGCAECSETLMVITDADQITIMVNTAMAPPTRALSAAWDTIVPHMRPRTLDDMGEDSEVDLSVLQRVLETIPGDMLVSLAVVASQLCTEANRVHNERMLAVMRESIREGKSGE